MKRSMAPIRLVIVVLLLAAVFQIQVPAAQSTECTEGATKLVRAGSRCSCFDSGTPKSYYKCIGGVWEFQFSYCGAPFCHEPGGGEVCTPEDLSACPYEPNMVCPPNCSCCY